MRKDVKYLSDEHDLETPIIVQTSSLKRYLVQEYSNDIAFFPSGKYLLVHPIDINPCNTLLRHFMPVIYEILTLKYLEKC